jgi:sensor histidine kinase YesM
MYLSSTRTSELWPDTLRGALRAIAIAAVFWALAATLLYVLSPGLDTWPRLLVFHECVGMTMVACVLLLRRMRAFSQFRPMTRWVLTGVLAIPTGFVVGHQFAFLMLGEPLRMVGYLSVSLIPVLFTLLVGGVGLHYYAAREQLATEAAARSEAQRLAVDAQLRLLRAQLEPHMLFNTLANLRSLVREDADRAESMIDQLIVYLRSALAASQTESVALSREFAQLRAYLDIMSLRMGPRLTYTLDLPPELEATTVPPMLLQPLVENAIKHGLEPKVGPGSIEVVARAVTGSTAGIEIRVNDSGLGLPPDEEDGPAVRPAGASYGLQHVRDRLHAVYGPAARLSLERRRPAGVSALVFIPDRPGATRFDHASSSSILREGPP